MFKALKFEISIENKCVRKFFLVNNVHVSNISFVTVERRFVLVQ